MSRCSRVLLASLILAGLTPTLARAQSCEPLDNLDLLLAPAAGTLLFGEVHGSEEGPEFIGDLVCHLLVEGRKLVVVALEVPVEDQPQIDRFLDSDGSPEDRRGLLATEFWSRPYQDGRSSAAMLELLERQRTWRQAGVSVVAFDSYARSDDRDRALAERLSAIRQGNLEATLVVLTGNLHNRISVGTSWDPDFQPMALYLESGSFRSFDLAQPAGTAWICQGSTPEDCGEVRLAGNDESGTHPMVELFDGAEAGPAYHGRVILTSRTASPPATDLKPD